MMMPPGEGDECKRPFLTDDVMEGRYSSHSSHSFRSLPDQPGSPPGAFGSAFWPGSPRGVSYDWHALPRVHSHSLDMSDSIMVRRVGRHHASER
jgi:hypothetical protein